MLYSRLNSGEELLAVCPYHASLFLFFFCVYTGASRFGVAQGPLERGAGCDRHKRPALHMTRLAGGMHSMSTGSVTELS